MGLGASPLADKGHLHKVKTGKSQGFLWIVLLGKLGFNPLDVLQGKAGPSLQPHLFFLVMMRTSLKRKRWQRRPAPRRKSPASSESSRCSSPRFSSHRDTEISGKGWNRARKGLGYCPPHQQQAKSRLGVNLQWPWGQLGWTHHMCLSVF